MGAHTSPVTPAYKGKMATLVNATSTKKKKGAMDAGGFLETMLLELVTKWKRGISRVNCQALYD